MTALLHGAVIVSSLVQSEFGRLAPFGGRMTYQAGEPGVGRGGVGNVGGGGDVVRPGDDSGRGEVIWRRRMQR